MSASDCKKTRITKTTTAVLAEHSTLEMLDLALLSVPDLPIRDMPEVVVILYFGKYFNTNSYRNFKAKCIFAGLRHC